MGETRSNPDYAIIADNPLWCGDSTHHQKGICSTPYILSDHLEKW